MKPLGLAAHAIDAPAFLGRGRGAAALFLGAPLAFDQWLIDDVMLNVVYKRGVCVRICATLLHGVAAAHRDEIMRWLSLDRLPSHSFIVDDRLSNLVSFSLAGHGLP